MRPKPPQVTIETLKEFFARTPRLAELCTQNGWPEPCTLEVEIIREAPEGVICSVSFEEVIMEGSGCEAARVPCWGRYRVKLDAKDRIGDVQLEMGRAEEV